MLYSNENCFDYRFALDLDAKEHPRIHRVLPRHPLGLQEGDVISLSQLAPFLQERLRGEIDRCDLVPGWTIGSKLFCWCETHHRWNEHGSCGQDVHVEFRVPHHRHDKTLAIVVQGEGRRGSALWNILSRYPYGLSKYTPPTDGLVRLIIPQDTLPHRLHVRALRKPEQLFSWVSPTIGGCR